MSICAPNCCSWQTAAPAAEGKKGRHLRFLPSLNTRFPWQPTLGGSGRLRKRRKKENGSRIFTTAWYPHIRISAMLLLHIPVTYRRRGITVPRKFLCTLQSIQHPAVRSRLAQENVLCGTGMPRLRGANRLCSSTVAEMRIGVIQRGRKKSSVVPLFRSGLISTVTAVPSKERQEFKEKGKP